MKKIINIFIVFLMAIILLNTFNINKSYAAPTSSSAYSVYGGGSSSSSSSGISTGDYNPSGTLSDRDSRETDKIARNIIGAFQAIGSIVSVLGLIFIGIKYMMGSIEQKAEYKKTMIPYLIGAILVFAIPNISAMLYDFAKNYINN